MIQDTSFLIDLLRGDDAALARLDDIESRNRPEKVASVTVLELHEGIERSTRPADEREQVLEVLASKTVVPADHDLMAQAGRLSGRLSKTGNPVDREDCVIAATALAAEEPVVTGNRADFERVQGLDVLSY